MSGSSFSSKPPSSLAPFPREPISTERRFTHHPGPRAVYRVRGRPVPECGADGRRPPPFVFTRSVDRSSKHCFSPVLPYLAHRASVKSGAQYPPEIEVSRGVTPTLGEDLFPSSSSSDLVTGLNTLLVLLAIFKRVPGLLLGKMELGTLPRSMCHVE
jgi:hypothetical protein